MLGEIDGYVLLRELGRGGAGTVFLAQRRGEVPVALKLMQVSFESARLAERVRREVQALLALNHPGVVRLRGAGTFQGRPYMVMDYVEGETLEEILKKGPLSTERAIELVGDLADAMQHVHDRGLLHRDLKPDNVLIDRDGRCYVTDFGLTRTVVAPGKGLTRSGSYVGTPGYWPPEQALGLRESTGPPADVYGLGGILYACLTGRPPRPTQLSIESLKQPIVPPHRLRAGVPRWLSAVCMACLRDDPEGRLESPGHLARALEGGRRSPLVLPLVVGALTAVAILGVIVTLTLPPSEPGQEPTELAEQPGPSPSPEPKPEPGPPPASEEPAPPPEPDPGDQREARALERALKLLELGDHAAALEVLQPFLDVETGNAEVWLAAGRARSGLGKNALAILDLERAVELDPELGRAWMCIAHVLRQVGKHERALAAIERSVLVSPELADAHFNHGRILQQLARHEEAVLAYGRCIALRPEDAGALTNRGVTLVRLRRTADALLDFNRALSLERNNPIALEQRANLLLRAGHYEDALADLTLALRLEPNPPALNWMNHGVILAKLRRNQEAVRSFQQAMRLGYREPTVYLNLGRVLVELGSVDEARAAFEEALKLMPPGPLREQVEADLARLGRAGD